MIVHPPSRSLLLRVQHPDKIREVLPHAVCDIDYEDHNVAVHHDVDVTRVLRNLGINAPSPILHYYDWPGRFDAEDHQKETAAFCTMHKRGFVLNEMGTMKTASVLWAADYLMNVGHVKKVLIVSPLSTLDLVWGAEIFNVLMHRKAVVLHADRARRLKLLEADVDFYIINHDGLRIIAEEVKSRPDINLVIIDEVGMYRNGGTDRYEDLVGMLRPDMWVWPLSGTPCPKAPTDAWALARILDKTRVPRYFGEFRRQTMVQVSQYKWVPRLEGARIAFEALQPAIRFMKKDCLQLPPMTFQRRMVPLSAEQKRMYDEMRTNALAHISPDSSRAAAKASLLGETLEPVTAVNAADRIVKCRQILCGAFKDPVTGTYIPVDHAPRVKVLIELIESAGAKAIVIVPFKGILRLLKEELSSTYSCEIINGDVSRHDRQRIITNFKNDTDPHVLLCHPQVMAHGLNLTEADVIIFYAPIYSNDQYQQVIERINRSGQKLNMTCIQMGATWLEWEIYGNIASQQKTQMDMLDLYTRFANS